MTAEKETYTAAWNNLKKRYIFLAAVLLGYKPFTWFAGTILPALGIIEIEVISPLLWAFIFLSALTAIYTFKCPRCKKRLFPFFRWFYLGEVFQKAYAGNSQALFWRTCARCDLPLGSGVGEGKQEQNQEYTPDEKPPLPNP